MDPVNDIIGFYSPFEKALFILGTEKEGVMKTLNVQPSEVGYYQIQTIDIQRHPITLKFRIFNVDLNSILYYSNEYSRKLYDNLSDKNTAGGKLIQKFKGTDGTFLRIYKNAKCVNARPPFISPCQKITTSDSTTGKFFNNEYLPLSIVVKGEGYCVEALIVTQKMNIYNDNGCQNVVESYPSYEYSCIK